MEVNTIFKFSIRLVSPIIPKQKSENGTIGFVWSVRHNLLYNAHRH